MVRHAFTAAEIGSAWLRDGDTRLDVLGPREVNVTAATPMAIWCPTVYAGKVQVEFECLVPAAGTKLLLLLYGQGSDGTPVRAWTRDGSYDGYNTERMEVYSIAINRGAHISAAPGDQHANVRRIGGKGFAVYAAENFRKHGVGPESPFWREWNTLSLLGAALEPVSGTGKYIRYRVTVEPPHLFLAVDGVSFAEIVDHRPNPLTRGSVGFRCMTPGRAFCLRNVAIEGTPVAPDVARARRE